MIGTEGEHCMVVGSGDHRVMRGVEWLAQRLWRLTDWDDHDQCVILFFLPACLID